MDDAVDQVMEFYENLPALERLGREEIRMKVGQYLAKLSSAGHFDTEELAFCGLVYLRILHEGSGPRRTGC
jgi:hypothetical protein